MFQHLCPGDLQSHTSKRSLQLTLQSCPSSHSFGARPVAVKANKVLLHDLSDHLTPYPEASPDTLPVVQKVPGTNAEQCSATAAQAWALQKQLVADLLAQGQSEGLAGHLVLVQHTPVFTLGSGSSLQHLGFDPDDSPHPLYRTERGGEVTYHGPGQLVAYPILNLRAFRPDLHWYLRSLEEVVIRYDAHVHVWACVLAACACT